MPRFKSIPIPARVILASVLVALSACVFLPGGAHARPKTDFLRMVDGDAITVEIKDLQLGKLSCKTHSMGTVSIEWEDIIEIKSSYYFRLMTTEGRLLFGSIGMSAPVAPVDSSAMGPTPADSSQVEDLSPELIVLPVEERSIMVRVGTLVIEIPMNEVVEITALERSFWSRIDGSLTVGFNFTKVSDVGEFTFDWRTIYREEQNRISSDAITSITQKGSEEEPRRRLDYSAGYTRRLVHSWSASTSLAFQRNDELGLRARYIASLGAGYYPIYSNHNFLNTILGVALNVEEGGGEEAALSANWEAQLGTQYSLFLYNSPKTDINLSVDGFVGLTENDRYRLSLETKFRRELFSDFFFDITYYLDWDNRNPTTGTESIDWGITAGISWTY